MPGTTGVRPVGATRSGRPRRRHASATSGVESGANAFARSRLSTRGSPAPTAESPALGALGMRASPERLPRQARLDLARVVQVVAGDEGDHLLERETTELRVAAPALQILSLDAVDELHVGLAERDERLEGAARIDPAIARVLRPSVLVHADERDAGALVHGPQPVSPEHLDL